MQEVSGLAAQATLYEAILGRRSLRRYDQTPLDEATLARVLEAVAAARPLVPANRFQARLESTAPGQDLVRDLGGYGRLVNPPHYLVPYVVGEEHPFTDLGCRVEQVAVRLAALGVGSCFIGCAHREEAVRARFGLPEAARVAAFLVFGRPSATPGGRAANALVRASVRATNKLPTERIFFQETFDRPSAPPAPLAPLLEAARRAPSADNTQPWRFLWHGRRLHLFVRRRNTFYGFTLPVRYALHDGGTCLGNMVLAMEALGIAGGWRLYPRDGHGAPPHPPGLIPLAWLATDT